MIITCWRSQPAHSSPHTSAFSCSNPLLYTYASLPLTLEKKKEKKVMCLIMFPPVQARSLRYKAILSDCRKQSQEMEMHCVALSATSGYLFGRTSLFFFFHGNPPFFCISLGILEPMCERWRKKGYSVL